MSRTPLAEAQESPSYPRARLSYVLGLSLAPANPQAPTLETGASTLASRVRPLTEPRRFYPRLFPLLTRSSWGQDPPSSCLLKACRPASLQNAHVTKHDLYLRHAEASRSPRVWGRRGRSPCWDRDTGPGRVDSRRAPALTTAAPSSRAFTRIHAVLTAAAPSQLGKPGHGKVK